MPRPEHLKDLSEFANDFARLSLCIKSPQSEYKIDLEALKSLARFMGFAEVKILSNKFLPSLERDEALVSSKVFDLETEHLPPKAKWRKIVMYLDVDRISECLEQGFTERERADRIEELIKDELKKRGMENFKEFSKVTFLFGDVYLFLASMILCVFLLEKYGLQRTAYPELLFWGAVAIKEMLSVIDTLVHYQGTSYGARFTALEATQILNLLLLDSKLNNTKLVYLEPKKPRV